MNAVVVTERNDSPVATITPMQMLSAAMERGTDMAQLEKLMELQERWDTNNARRAFNAAFAAFKAEAVTIIRGTTIKDGPLKGKTHATLHDVIVATTPKLSVHGLALSWRLSRDEKDWMEVTCTLRHVDGHSETVSMGAAPDTGPGRNAIQARGSSTTYLERYTATAILGLATSDQDDDGGASGDAETITDKQAADLDCLLAETGADKAQFMQWAKVSSLDQINAKNYDFVCREVRERAKTRAAGTDAAHRMRKVMDADMDEYDMADAARALPVTSEQLDAAWHVLASAERTAWKKLLELKRPTAK